MGRSEKSREQFSRLFYFKLFFVDRTSNAQSTRSSVAADIQRQGINAVQSVSIVSLHLSLPALTHLGQTGVGGIDVDLLTRKA